MQGLRELRPRGGWKQQVWRASPRLSSAWYAQNTFVTRCPERAGAWVPQRRPREGHVRRCAASGSLLQRLSLKLSIPIIPKCTCRAASPLVRRCLQSQMLQGEATQFERRRCMAG